MEQMKIYKVGWTFLILTVIFSQMACEPSDLSKESIIPLPVSVKGTGESFCMNDQTKVLVVGESAELMQVSQYMVDQLNPSTGLGLKNAPTT